MRLRRRARGLGAAVQGVARTAAVRIERRELIEKAVHFLLASAKADRIGVWMETADTERQQGAGEAGFRGLVADRDGEPTPPEWDRLSPEAPLPVELLNNGKSVEQDLDGRRGRTVVGALLEIHRALWVPVEIRGRLRGVLLAGLRNKHGELPVRLLESVSAELALALELDEERRMAHERQSDLAASNQFLDQLADSGPSDTVLTLLVAGCTDPGPEGNGLGAVFAVLHPHDRAAAMSIAGALAEPSGPTATPCEPAQEIPPGALGWQSGDPAWLHALESQPLAGIWQKARDAHTTITTPMGAGTSSPRGGVSRLVSIGLQAAGETIGVLTAGFRGASGSGAAVERLELRARLATTALVCRERNHEAARQQTRLKAILQASSAATILVDKSGAIAGLSRGAREILREGPLESRLPPCEGLQTRKFADLFLERPRIETWLQSLRDNPRLESGIDEDPPEAELSSGARARLRCIHSSGGLTAISLESLAAPDAAPGRRRADAQLFNVIEWLDEGVVLFDPQHGIQAMNSRFAQIAGLTPADTGAITTLHGLINCLADQAAEPEKFAKRWRELARGANSGVREEIQLLRPLQRVLERTGQTVLDADGRPIGRLEIYRDLTPQRAFQSKLLQTEKLAALGQMVTGVAHELSNPLTSILGYAQRLFLRSQAEGQPDEVRQIFQEAERASTIVRQLLMSARESRPERRRLSLNKVVLRTMDLQKISLSGENVAVELDLDEALPLVLGDQGQLQQVLMNLLGNARQSIEQSGKGGTIRLVTKCLGSGRRAQLEVSDDGPGIPPAIASRIFDPFFTTKPAGRGTGLGLAIVLGVVREHGGHVKVASPPGGGAVFTLEFPAAPAEPTRFAAVPATGPGRPNRDTGLMRKAAVEQRSLQAGTSALASGIRTRVLVVEDEPTVARLISDVLEDEGFQVDALLDGHEALERAARTSYDLVICDMKMPGMDGQHFYELLAGMGNPLARRFLFVTGDVLSPHTHAFLERYRLPHVAKPFRVEELTEKVRGMLAEARPNDVLSPPEARTKVARSN